MKYIIASLHLAAKLGAVKIGEIALIDELPDIGLPQSIIDEVAGYSIYVHEIRKQDWC